MYMQPLLIMIITFVLSGCSYYMETGEYVCKNEDPRVLTVTMSVTEETDIIIGPDYVTFDGIKLKKDEKWNCVLADPMGKVQVKYCTESICFKPLF